MTRIRTFILDRPVVSLLWTIAAAVLLLGGFIGVAAATDSPDFCTSCHEMQPYHTAWEAGAHADVPCVACHVDAGLVERVSHKIDASYQVWEHITGDPRFPLAEMPEIPQERCTTCHEDIEGDTPGFDHEAHADGGACIECHAGTGHEVSSAALIEAGIFDSEHAAARAEGIVAVRGQGRDNLVEHPATLCSDCHDMERTGCDSCHESDHEPRGLDCTTCHEPAGEWVFLHPDDGGCNSCHGRPDDHVLVSDDTTCEQCHAEYGVSWAFAHPAADDGCSSCHARPTEHRAGECATCHQTIEAGWAFSHPDRSAVCSDCHSAPARHAGGTCANCHTTGVSWAFNHPGSGSNCTSCHARPAKHSTATCSNCHSTGRSWAFNHPSSTNCSSCHRAPSSHYGTSCASCHSPSRSWGSATFTHPSLREHSYKSFSCVSCHPSGYSSASCTGCHGAGGPDDDEHDDD